MVISAMIKHKYPLDTGSFIKNKGCVMSFSLTKHLRVHDLYLFINTSLAKACEAYGLDKRFWKTDLDHSKIYSWETVYQHQEEVCQYLKMDVIALRELYRVYAKVLSSSSTKSRGCSLYFSSCLLRPLSLTLSFKSFNPSH
jgi:hypothetical protein